MNDSSAIKNVLLGSVVDERRLFSGAHGPIIFSIGSTFLVCAVATPRCIPGRPSMLTAFLYAQYLA